MNILFIAPSVPSRFQRIRSVHLIKCLQKNHNVVILSLSDSKSNSLPTELSDKCSHFETVYKSRWRSYFDCFLGIFSPDPFEVTYCKSPELKKKVSELIKKFNIDLVYVKRLRSAQFAVDVSVPIVLDSTDAMGLFYKKMVKQGQLFKKPLYVHEWLKYEWYEKKLSKTFKHWIVCSPVDCSYLDKRYSAIKCHCIPNSVDDYYSEPVLGSVVKGSIIISGLMDKWVNIDAVHFFMNSIYPSIRTNISSLNIVGPRPVSSIKKYNSEKVHILGEVADIRSEIGKSEIVACPVRIGTGTRNKIIQAWAIGRPVVSTSEGAAGLMAIDGKNIMLADDPKMFQEAIERLRADPAKMESLIDEGKKTVLEYYSASAVEQKIQEVISNLKITK